MPSKLPSQMIYSICDSEKRQEGEKKWHRNMKGLPPDDKNWEKNWASGHLAQSHTCQASSLLGDNHSSDSFYWDAAVSRLHSKRAFTALGKGQHTVARALHPGSLQRAVAQPSLKFSTELLQDGSPEECHLLGLLRKKQKRAMPFPPG